jgi:hypothetical protein
MVTAEGLVRARPLPYSFLEPEFDAAVEDCRFHADHANLPASILPVQAHWKPGQTIGDFHVATVSVTVFATD